MLLSFLLLYRGEGNRLYFLHRRR